MRFFIVGNGFDLYHRLPTKYIDFIHFLEKDFPDVYVGLCNLMMKYSLTHFDRNIVEDNYWSEFEEMLGSIEVLELAEEHRDWSTTRDYSGKPNSEILKMLEFGVKSNLYILPWMKNINKKEIPKHEKNKKIEALVQKDSEFLNFNYSQTLEIIYNIDVTKVLHIHGTPPRKLIIGHSEGYNVQGDSEEIGINLMNEKYIKKYFTRTRKKTRSIIQKNNIFFGKEHLKSVSEIYILGHSLGDIDLPYFREIIKKINNEIEWKIYAYSLSEEKYYSEKMRKLGITNFRFLIWDDL